jgi:hypothetical protein
LKHNKTFESRIDLIVVNVLDGYVVQGVGKANEVLDLNENVGTK